MDSVLKRTNFDRINRISGILFACGEIDRAETDPIALMPHP
jgi:hypothetical protein